jgi:DsbC/DsbD-like thiol-disulfide interchange protein
MKKYCLSSLLLLITVISFAQEENPVKWSFTAKKISDKTYEVYLTAKIEDGWHIYSQTTPDGGPVATSISYTKNPLITIDGGIKEAGKLEKHFEKLFGIEVFQFSKKVDFIQTIKLKTNAKTNLIGAVEFMVCNDEMCMPPKSVPFNVVLK